MCVYIYIYIYIYIYPRQATPADDLAHVGREALEELLLLVKSLNYTTGRSITGRSMSGQSMSITGRSMICS